MIEDTDGDLCHYHGMEHDSAATEAVTIDADLDLLARWCGTRATTWEEIPEPCCEALEQLLDDT